MESIARTPKSISLLLFMLVMIFLSAPLFSAAEATQLRPGGKYITYNYLFVVSVCLSATF